MPLNAPPILKGLSPVDRSCGRAPLVQKLAFLVSQIRSYDPSTIHHRCLVLCFGRCIALTWWYRAGACWKSTQFAAQLRQVGYARALCNRNSYSRRRSHSRPGRNTNFLIRQSAIERGRKRYPSYNDGERASAAGAQLCPSSRWRCHLGRAIPSGVHNYRRRH